MLADPYSSPASASETAPATSRRVSLLLPFGFPRQHEPKGFDFGSDEIRKGTHARRVSHISVHHQIEGVGQFRQRTQHGDQIALGLG
jgi:hypothetical protein